MGAKISAETLRAVRAVQRGTDVYKAARRHRLAPSTIYRALIRLGMKIPKSAKDAAS